MSDIVADIRQHLLTMAPHQRERLTAWQLLEAADEIERLREAIRRLADQDATLSVVGGNVIVEVDATPSECGVPERDTIAAEPPVSTERDNEWLKRPYYVDPPQGWRYGFPKLYDPAKDGDLTEWLVANGYPKHLADKNLPCTFTAATE